MHVALAGGSAQPDRHLSTMQLRGPRQSGASPSSVPGMIMVCLGGLLLAQAARTLASYPTCHSDEHMWAFIAAQVAQGVDWPISGPLHFAIMRWLANITGGSHADTLAVMGVISTPFILLVLFGAYRVLGIARPLSVIAVLCTSTYFWAPLMESRPQQWGQALVALGLGLGWRAMKDGGRDRRIWWAFAGVTLLTAATHILSFAILAAACALVWTWMFVLGLAQPRDLARLAIATTPGILLFLIPGGPYEAMLFDILHFQLLFTLPSPWLLACFATLGLVCAATLLFLMRRYASAFTQLIFTLVDRHSATASAGLAIAAIVALGTQAALLPVNAWEPYRGSVGLFVLSQTGNLFFLALLLRGLIKARHRWLNGENRTEAQTVALLLMTAATLAGLTLAASVWLLHTNWMLRVINYSILWIAPFAAWGLVASNEQRTSRTLQTLCLLFGLVSLMSAIRPSSLFNC